MKHRYRIAVLLCLQFLMINVSFSQRRDNGFANHVKLKSFNLELLGNALGYSLNYDCLSIIDKKTAWSYRLGFAYYTNLQEHWLAFTEHGVLMLSSVLSSSTAIQVNIKIMRVYTRLREMFLTNKDILLKLEQIALRYAVKFLQSRQLRLATQ